MECNCVKFAKILNEIKGRKPCWMAKWVSIQIKDNSILNKKTPAWTRRNKIYISTKYQDTDDLDIIKYLVAHEYGHIYKNHTIIPLIAGAILLCSLMFVNLPIFWIISLIPMIALLWCTFLGREFEADKIVAIVYNPQLALKGLRWGQQFDSSNDRKKRIQKIEALIFREERFSILQSRDGSDDSVEEKNQNMEVGK